MALRTAYKERLAPSEELSSAMSVGNIRGYNPSSRGNPTPRKTSDVIDNAFGFLGTENFDAYSRYDSDPGFDDFDLDRNENFSFGPPREGGFGPTSASYDRRDLPRDSRLPFSNDDSEYDGNSIGLAKDLANRFARPNDLGSERIAKMRRALNSHGNGHANDADRNGYVNNAYVHDRTSDPMYSRSPGRGRSHMNTIDEDLRDRNIYQYPSDPSRFSDDNPRYRDYPPSYDRQGYPDSRMGSDPYGLPDDRRRYEDDRRRNPDERSREKRLPRITQEANGYGSSDYHHNPRDKRERPKSGAVRSKSTKAAGNDGDSKSTKTCLIIVILVVGFLIVAGVVTVVVLYFKGFFDTGYQDGYIADVEFYDTFKQGMNDTKSQVYKNAEKDFITLASNALNEEPKFKNMFDVKLNSIREGSTIFNAEVLLEIRITAEELRNRLKVGILNATTGWALKSINVTVHPKYNDGNPDGATTTVRPTGTTLYTQTLERTTPTPPNCQALKETQCETFNIIKTGASEQNLFLNVKQRVADNCYPHTLEFACAVAYSPCSNDGSKVRRPCRSFCNAFRENCRHNIDCLEFPDDDDNNLCYMAPGGLPTDETVIRTQIPVPCTQLQFQCDDGTCVPKDNNCNQVNNCVDRSDEIGCNTITVAELTCTFENGNMCQFVAGNGDFNWTLHKGPTSSLNTGPRIDHTLKTDQGTYIYAEGSGHYAYSTARFNSPEIPTNYTEVCLRFYYHMLGTQVESLQVIQEFTDTVKKIVWKRTHDHGDKFRFAAVTLPYFSTTQDKPVSYKVVFEAKRGDGYQSDIAIDDIIGHRGACRDSEPKGCAADEFTCANGNCIVNKFKCDSVNHCGDFSDERTCTCDIDQFKCDFGMCINDYQRCDKKNDCPDHSDEKNCTNVCSMGRRKCNDGQTCILREWLCDHEEDCPNGDDEKGCPTCQLGYWKCRDNTCINETQVCNTKNDCLDGSDEDVCYELGKDNNVLLVRKNSPSVGTPVCSVLINLTVYDQFCDLLGYWKANTTGTFDMNGVQKYAVYTPSSTAKTLLQQLPILSFSLCSSGSASTLTCISNECGKPKNISHAVSYSANDDSVVAGQWPWQVAIYVLVNNDLQFTCGGSLVDHYHVITAAHCVKSSNKVANYFVYLGLIYRTPSEDSNRKGFPISHIQAHPSYSEIHGNDIAILTLDEYVEFNDFIKPLCLPTPLDSFPLSAQCYITGFGPKNYDRLQEAKLKLWNDTQCQSAYITYNPNKHTCAGYRSGYIGNCPVDSGGPLQCRDAHGYWKLYGVFSFSAGCDVPEHPPVFTKTVAYLDWILANIECKFTCTTTKRCIMSTSQLCDGSNDCGDFSDEMNCTSTLACDFDTSDYACGWSYLDGTKQFKRLNRVTDINRGPITDITQGKHDGYFMYADSMSDQTLVSPIIIRTTAGCLRFVVHTRGVTIGNLEIITVSNIPDSISHPAFVKIPSDAPKLTINATSLDKWQYHQVALPANRFVVVFKALSPGSIAIDDIKVEEGQCSNTPDCTGGSLSCSMQCVKPADICNYQIACSDNSTDEENCNGKQKNYMCDMETYGHCFLNQVSDSVTEKEDWLYVEGGETKTGPANDHTPNTTKGHYLLFNSTTRGSYAIVNLSVSVPSVSCFSFFYNMNSSTLQVEGCDDSCAIIFYLSKQDTAIWKEVNLNLKTTFRTIAIKGNSSGITQGYIAIDDLMITSGICPDPVCAPSEFKCTNGPCITRSLICDKQNNCTDGSDESETLCKDKLLTGPDFFRCNDGYHIQAHLRCNGYNECSDTSDEANCTALCFTHEFACADGKCKNRYSNNDGIEDCVNGTDETKGCNGHQFQCLKSKKCIPGFRKCNGIPDCSDASDEDFNCTYVTSSYFTCKDGMRIPIEYHCDGTVECKDGSDETDQCQYTCQSTTSSTFKWFEMCDGLPNCPNGEDETQSCTCPYKYKKCDYGGCRKEAMFCDGKYDCEDHSDENGCTCPDQKPYKCHSGMCIEQNRRCNNVTDCDDWSDELGCNCTTDQFQCQNRICIPNSKKCNKVNDCGDGSDELNCTCDTATEFQCVQDKKCIPLAWKCDRENDCTDGADEQNCITCGATEFACNMSQYDCKPIKKRCDGTADCQDGSDETQCEKIEASSLEVQASNGSMMKVCHEDWNPIWSDDICYKIGKGKANATTPATPSGTLFYKVNATVTNKPLYSPDMLTIVENCTNVVNITCADAVCGIKPVTTVAHIIGGLSLTNAQRFPWLGMILVRGKPTCAAAILNQDWVLTAGHCFTNETLTPHYVTVVLGTTKLSYNNSNDENAVERQVTRVVRHPDFAMDSQNILTNDIALIKMKTPVLTTNTNVRYICVPQGSDILPSLARCYVAGWGKINSGTVNQVIPPTLDLQYTKIRPAPDSTCSAIDPWGAKFDNTKHLCVGQTSLPGPCNGDSGGPLMCTDNSKRWTVWGVTSFGASACDKPAVFTRLQSYKTWITATIAT